MLRNCDGRSSAHDRGRVAALALFGLGWANAAAEHPPLRPAWVKGMPEDLSRYDFVGWNTYSRVTVGPPVLEPPHLWAGSRLMPPELRAPVGQRTILIDGAAAELGAWLWGLNGAAGVCASALALACSMIWGVAVTLAVGAACYLVLLGCTRARSVIEQHALPPTRP